MELFETKTESKSEATMVGRKVASNLSVSPGPRIVGIAPSGTNWK